MSTGAPPWRPAAILDESVSTYLNLAIGVLTCIIRWVLKEARPISLRQLTFFGRTLTEARLKSSANYVRTELPTRLLSFLPFLLWFH